MALNASSIFIDTGLRFSFLSSFVTSSRKSFLKRLSSFCCTVSSWSFVRDGREPAFSVWIYQIQGWGCNTEYEDGSSFLLWIMSRGDVHVIATCWCFARWSTKLDAFEIRIQKALLRKTSMDQLADIHGYCCLDGVFDSTGTNMLRLLLTMTVV